MGQDYAVGLLRQKLVQDAASVLAMESCPMLVWQSAMLLRIAGGFALKPSSEERGHDI